MQLQRAIVCDLLHVEHANIFFHILKDQAFNLAVDTLVRTTGIWFAPLGKMASQTSKRRIYLVNVCQANVCMYLISLETLSSSAIRLV